MTASASRSAATTVLFVAEAVTLAHVARPVSLAAALAGPKYRVVFAADPRFASVCPTGDWTTEPLRSISTERFVRALAEGAPLYDRPTLRQYVADDLALLQRTQPAVVVGDFRLSLSVSARLLGIPYINISNAYWSPYARPVWHAPDLSWSRLLPGAVADAVFRAARPLAFRMHAAPMEALRREHGQPALGADLLRTYTDGDITLYADPAELVPLHGAPATHRHLGPVPWSPAVPLPAWWNELDPAKPIVYVTLGSSGNAGRLPGIVQGLAGLGTTVVVAGAGAALPEPWPAGVRAADYLPGDVVAQRSALVVCNGGSPTSHQALAQGVPVLGLPGNLDQFLNMGYLQAAGVGAWMRPAASTPRAIARLATAMLGNTEMHRKAEALAEDFTRYDPGARLAAAIDELAAARAGGAPESHPPTEP